MGVPSFSDLGESARNVFKTGYHYGKGLMKLNVRIKSGGSFEMGSDLSLNFDASKMTGWTEAKYKTKESGTFMEKWTTDGTLITGYDFNGKILQNIGLHSEFSYNTETAAKSIKIGAKCVNEKFNAACAVSSDFSSNVNVFGSIVTAFKDLLIGYQGGYNSETNKMTKNDIGLAFGYNDLGFHFRCTSIPNEYGLSVLYKVNSDWDAAINGILARSAQDWTMGAGAKYKIDNKSTLRFKFNTDLQLGTSLQQKLDENVTLTLSFNVDCANVTRGGHKVGLALEIEA